MRSTRVLSLGAVVIGFLVLVGVLGAAAPPTAHAAWVSGTQFQVGAKITEIVPTLVSTTPPPPGIANTPALVNPACGTAGGTSLALVRGAKLKDVDPVLYPIVLVVSCLSTNATVRSRLNFINPITFTTTVNEQQVTVQAGTVVKQILTRINSVVAAPSTGWAHLVHRPDKGDLLGCGSNGVLYSIDYSQTNSVTDGTATQLSTPALGACGGLAWDGENETIYQGVPGNGSQVGTVARFKEGDTSPAATFTTALACAANGLAISGGVVLAACGKLQNSVPVIQRLDKNTGANLGLYSSISLPVPGTALGLTALPSSTLQLGDLACDPVTFQKNAAGRDLYRDALWSRRGTNGNGVAAVEFPAFTCGLPSSSVVGSFSPLAAGLSTGTAASPGQSPKASCFDSSGIVIDTDGDGLPDCWEINQGGSGTAATGGIDFDGDGARDVTLCAQVNQNGNGTTLVQECANPSHKDLFVQVGWMDNHKPDPLALSQPDVATVGVRSVREAFKAAPVSNPAGGNGIDIHIQVDKQPVSFLPATGTTTTTHVTNVALTPCTGPASTADTADYDAIKATNFGRFDATLPPLGTNARNAMRLAFRYVLFAHNLVGNPGGGSNSSGCAEVGVDDAIVSMGGFTSTTVNGITHPRGTTDQQAGTFMHEFGHLLGFEHGGEDTINNKPNYRSVMSYTRQFSGSPITNRRLDYSRSEVDLDEETLNECTGLGTLLDEPTLGPIPGFPSADQIAFGPGAWSVVTPSSVTAGTCAAGQLPINWDRLTGSQNATTGDINGDLDTTTLFGSNDWARVLYRLSAAIDFAGGRSETLTTSPSESEMTSEDENANFLKKDADGKGIGDSMDCGGTITEVNGVLTTSFPCTHRIDIKPSFPLPKILNLGSEATLTVAIFSETNGPNVWDPTTQVQTLTNGCTESTAPCLTFSVANVVVAVKTNQNGQGTCSAQNLADPVTGQDDGIKDLKCQFRTTGLPIGEHFGVVSGYFVDPLDTNAVKAFSARQQFTILP